MRVIIQKPDLDTCLTALILGVTEKDNLDFVKDKASEADLFDPNVICIEVGGSGQVHLNNFDHHQPQQELHPACCQAYNCKGLKDAKLKRLMKYVCMVDNRIQDHPAVPFPSLSSIFSGMLFVEKLPRQQFISGIRILMKVLISDIDPFETMPDLDEWRGYRKAKEENNAKLSTEKEKAFFYISQGGRKIGFSESKVIGGTGGLYKEGCDAIIMLNPSFGEPPIRKFTIAGNGIRVSHLIALIDPLEKGWGGRETIIGSPKERSSDLSKEKVIELVRLNL